MGGDKSITVILVGIPVHYYTSSVIDTVSLCISTVLVVCKGLVEFRSMIDYLQLSLRR